MQIRECGAEFGKVIGLYTEPVLFRRLDGEVAHVGEGLAARLADCCLTCSRLIRRGRPDGTGCPCSEPSYPASPSARASPGRPGRSAAALLPDGPYKLRNPLQ